MQKGATREDENGGNKFPHELRLDSRVLPFKRQPRANSEEAASILQRETKERVRAQRQVKSVTPSEVISSARGLTSNRFNRRRGGVHSRRRNQPINHSERMDKYTVK
eukprot:GHVU01124552.1.p1 GENE.GHVU01124552.1~~GHVU01124552.1.p1  ORF type:complete len:107 (+),score=9.15 GHVU01124552.1:1777-2097(+)